MLSMPYPVVVEVVVVAVAPLNWLLWDGDGDEHHVRLCAVCIKRTRLLQILRNIVLRAL